jgi:hypothetical protein
MRTCWLTCALVSAALCACGNNTSGGDDNDNGKGPYTPPFASCAGTGQPPPAPDGSLCLVDPTMPTLPPLAIIEHEFVKYNGVDAVHLSIVLDPHFVDNTYGVNKVGWPKGHNFPDLVESDHAEIKVLDAQGNVVLDFNLDYISPDPTKPCGYGCLGVDGGEGNMISGDRAAILGWTSSLDRNLNERGYCLTQDSPATDASCTPNPAAPDWDFRVVYEVWVALSAFPNSFGSAYMSFVHASPSKLPDKTVPVQPGPCPCVEIDTNQCEPPPPSGTCTTNTECPTETFCYNQHCIPIIL